jgi:hypothetical protein
VVCSPVPCLCLLGLFGGPAALWTRPRRTLYLDTNSLYGTIPDGLSSLTNLGELNLYHNALVGDVPEGISAMTALT